MEAHHETSAATRIRKIGLKLMNCRKIAWLGVCTETQEPRFISVTCKSRLCSHCSKVRARQVNELVEAACRRMSSRRFLTVTLAPRSGPLEMQLNALRQYWTKLRRSKFWKARVTGGIMTIEVTWSEKHQAWHPHIHAIIDGEYLPKQALSDEWRRITGDSFIVDIRQANSSRQLANYLAKYISKTGDAIKLPKSRMAQYATAIHALRMAQTFGHLHGVKLKPDREPGEGRVELIATSGELHIHAIRGNIEAQRLEDRWKAVPGTKPHSIDVTLPDDTRAFLASVRPFRGGP